MNKLKRFLSQILMICLIYGDLYQVLEVLREILAGLRELEKLVTG